MASRIPLATRPLRRRMAELDPKTVGVLLGGYPSSLADETAKALDKRGVKILAALTSDADSKIEHGAPVLWVKDANAKQQVEQIVNDARNNKMSVVGVDVAGTAPETYQLFQQLKVPYVLNSQEGQTRAKATDEANAQQLSAVMTDDFNKMRTMFDEMFRDASRRFPGMLGDDWLFRGWESRPSMWQDFHESTHKLVDSFDRMFALPFQPDAVTKVRDPKQQQEDLGVPTKFLEGHVAQQFSGQTGDGSASFTFRTSYSGDAPAAEGVADSVLFLAQKSQELARPKVYSLQDVMERGSVPLLRSQ